MGNKLDLSARNDKATTKMTRLNTLATQVTKTLDEQNELISLQNELADYIISANDINIIAQVSDLNTTNSNIGDLSTLTTTDHSSLVNAANEVESRALATRSLQREIAQLKLVSSIKNRVNGASNIFYDDFSGSTAGSISQLDTYKSNITGALSVGAVSATPLSVSGLSIGREVTIQDVTNESIRERVIVSDIVGSVVSFATPIVNAYADQANIYRSIGLVDTVNKRLKFGGASYRSTFTNTNKTVVSSAYDTSGNGGDKIVKLDSENLYTICRNGTTDYSVYKSADKGVTWSLLITVTESTASVAITTDGTYLMIINSFNNTSVHFRKYNESGVLQGTVVSMGGTFSQIGNVSLAIDTGNGALHATFSALDSLCHNIIYTTSVDGGVTWSAINGTFAYATGSSGDANYQNVNPCVAIRNGIPIIVYELRWQGVGVDIFWLRLNGSTWSNNTVFNDPTHDISHPTVLVKQNGSNIGRVICRWHGLDGTDTSYYNERWAYSDDGVVTWTVVGKITSGNTIDRKNGTLSENTNGDIYITYQDGTAISYQKCADGTITFGSTTTLNATGANPSSIKHLGSAFTIPPTVYMSGTSVKFDGTYIATANLSLTQEDNRYNINPSSAMKSIVQWVDRNILTGFSTTSLASIVTIGANESFASMAKKTTNIDVSTQEDQFSYIAGTANTKITIRNTTNRASTSDVVYETQMSGAVST